MQDLVKWGWAISLGVNALIGWVLWSFRNAFASKDDLQQLDKRVTQAEATLKNMPTTESLHSVRIQLEELHGDLKGMSSEFKGMQEVLRRIEQPLNILVEHHMRAGNDR